MLTLDDRLRRTSEEVIAKVMDGEAVIINLANGRYHSTDKVGGTVFAMIDEGYTLREVVAAVTRRYDVAAARAEADVLHLAGELLGQELFVTDAQREPPAAPMADPAHDGKLPYTTPQLHAYTDMEDLLALDPPTPGLADIPWKE
jgi:hypothetical protein